MLCKFVINIKHFRNSMHLRPEKKEKHWSKFRISFFNIKSHLGLGLHFWATTCVHYQWRTAIVTHWSLCEMGLVAKDAQLTNMDQDSRLAEELISVPLVKSTVEYYDGIKQSMGVVGTGIGMVESQMTNVMSLCRKYTWSGNPCLVWLTFFLTPSLLSPTLKDFGGWYTGWRESNI